MLLFFNINLIDFGHFQILELNQMPVKNGDTIRVSYTGSFENGEVFDASSMHNNEPLEFTVGKGQVVKGFDDAVLNKDLHEEFDVHIDPSEGYGEYDDEKVQEIERSSLPDDLNPEIGMVLQLQHQHGDHTHNILASIKEITESAIKLDLNHPLAGKVLNFKIKIEEIL